MGLFKPSGQSATTTRKNTLHGSSARRGMAKWGGRAQRLNEKPGGWFTPRRPGRGR